MNKFVLFAVLFLALLPACQKKGADAAQFTVQDFQNAKWKDVETKAQGTTVSFAMWGGDEARNRFMNTEAAVRLKDKYGITLNILPLGDTAEAVNKLLNEKQANKTGGGSIDMIWINGENFRTSKSTLGEFCRTSAKHSLLRSGCQ
jgi:putative spermidine/putrescine transport system substrate-binding protein